MRPGRFRAERLGAPLIGRAADAPDFSDVVRDG